MSLISRLQRDQVSASSSTIYERYLRGCSNVPNMFRTMAHRPEIFETIIAHMKAVLKTGTHPPGRTHHHRSSITTLRIENDRNTIRTKGAASRRSASPYSNAMVLPCSQPLRKLTRQQRKIRRRIAHHERRLFIPRVPCAHRAGPTRILTRNQLQTSLIQQQAYSCLLLLQRQALNRSLKIFHRIKHAIPCQHRNPHRIDSRIQNIRPVPRRTHPRILHAHRGGSLCHILRNQLEVRACRCPPSRQLRLIRKTMRDRPMRHHLLRMKDRRLGQRRIQSHRRKMTVGTLLIDRRK